MKTTTDQGLRQNTRKGRGIWCAIGAVMFSLQLSLAQAAGLKLQSIDFTTLSGDELQLQLSLSGPAFSPRIFHTDNPARIALDLPGVGNEMEKKLIPVNVGGAESVQALEAAGRTRVIINLTAMTPYTSRVEGNKIYVTLKKSRGGNLLEAPSYTPARAPSQSEDALALTGRGIQNVDFRRGENGVGRLLVTLSDPKTVVDVREEGRKVIVDFPNTTLPSTLARRLDVQDFATPVQTIDSMMEGNRAKMVITPVSEDYDYSSYQSENLLTVEFRPLTKVEREEIKKKGFAYSGEKLSLNFQDIPVRNVLQILADFTNLNIVASDTVQGNVTLRLNEVPWDQALDLVLKARGLGKRQEGNIIRVAPLDEINKQEKEELEAQKVVEELEPLKTEIIQLNYTKADDVKQVLVGTSEKTSQSTSQPAGAGIGYTGTSTTTTSQEVSQSILSARGNVTIDPRTNQLIVKDTARNLERVRDLVRKIDIPVRQVLIESRIVIANNDFTRQLGSRLSARGPESNLVTTGGTTGGTATTSTNTPLPPNTFSSSTFGPTATGTAGALLTSLAAASPQATAGITLLKAGDFLLDLELSAAQTENRAEIISNPRLITADQTKAVIKQGEEIPYQATQAASIGTGGAPVQSITFKQAVLELNVTPHITPDDQILMELLIKKDARGAVAAGGNPAIDKREIQTTSQVSNGETVVLGGVYEATKQNTTDKVPFFGDLPGVGFMFRRNSVTDNKRELLIFITPKILRQNLGLR